MRNDLLKLDFRTKLFMSMILSYTLILGNIQQRQPFIAGAYALLPFVFLFLNKEYKRAVKGFVFIVIAIVIQYKSLLIGSGALGSIFLFIVMIFLRLLPGVMMAVFAISSSTMSEITLSLKKMRFPDVIIVPITVMTRFFYTAKEDYIQVRNAMYLHGLTNKMLFLNPIKFIEYKMVPLFMVLTKTADDVAVSALTRGLKINGERTYLCECKFKFSDYMCFLLMFILIGLYIGGKYA